MGRNLLKFHKMFYDVIFKLILSGPNRHSDVSRQLKREKSLLFRCFSID